MGPIVSPWLVYLVSFLANVACVASAVFFCSICVVAICFFYPSLCYNEKEAFYKAAKIREKALFVAIISLPIAVVIPPKSDMLAMIAMAYATPDNIQAVQGNVIEFIKQIAQVIK